MDRVYSIIIVFLFMSGVAAAFGSAAKTSSLHIYENKTAEFSLMFWGVNETIKLSVEDNNGLNISLDEIVDGRTDEMVYASGDYIPAAVAKVLAISVPVGNYSIIILAKTFGTGGQLTVVQERLFNLTVQSTFEEKPWWFIPLMIISYVYIPLVVIIILIIAFAIYKYS